MIRTYRVCSGDRPVGLREAPTAHAALLDFVRSMGCRDEELMRLGDDALSWRGAVFHAVPVSSEPTRSDDSG